jgi:hypothetical protein
MTGLGAPNVDAVGQTRLLSDALSRPLIGAYRAGGFGLAFLLLGAVLMLLSATLLEGVVTYLIAAAGFALIVVPCWFFWLKEMRPISVAQRRVRENTEMIDAVQAMAVSLTELLAAEGRSAAGNGS